MLCKNVCLGTCVFQRLKRKEHKLKMESKSGNDQFHEDVLMNGGDGEYSYAQNSSMQVLHSY